MKIVSAYLGQGNYIEEARRSPFADLAALWESSAIRPYWQQWAAGDFNEDRLRRELSQPIQDLAGLQVEVDALRLSQVESVVADAYAQIASRLPYHEADAAICLMAANPQDAALVRDHHGVLGACIGANTLLTINPAGENWQAWLGYVLAHERHHSAWGYHYYVNPGGGFHCLLASLVSEGAADAFARWLYPELLPIWLDALTPEEEARQWRLLQPLLTQPEAGDGLHRRVFFGDQEAYPQLPGRTPLHTGYTLGYHLVQAYLRLHPQLTPGDVAALMPADFSELKVVGM